MNTVPHDERLVALECRRASRDRIIDGKDTLVGLVGQAKMAWSTSDRQNSDSPQTAF